MQDQSNRVVLITGGSSGIGLEMAKQMVGQRSTVIICGRSQGKLDRAQQEIPQVVTIQCDITQAADRERLFHRISAEHGNLNMLMNNAGMARKFLFETTNNLEQHLHDEWQINYLAPVMLTKLFLPLVAKNKGTIVNVTTGLVYAPLTIEPNYCAMKSALHSMTQSMRLRFRSLGIKVVEIFYPAVDTPFQEGHAPTISIQPDEAAELALAGLNRGDEEIRVKRVSLLYMLSRIWPKRTLQVINRVVPENSEAILAEA